MFEEEGDGASANFVATPKTERLEAEDEDEDEDEDEGDVDFKPPLLRRTSTAGAAILNEPLVQKVPRGRSIPPVPPKPVERRRSSVLGGRRGSSNQRRKSQQILFVPKEQLQPGPKKPEWQTAYFGFKRKVILISYEHILVLQHLDLTIYLYHPRRFRAASSFQHF
jgi:hypothetical protein